MQIISPITKKENVSRIKTIEVSWITDQWKKQFNYDVEYLYRELKNIELYRCNDTGYLFYKPDIVGDRNLYEHLQGFDWYYMPWKWEHEIAMNYLKTGIDILEIGCAKGDFLDKISKHYKLNAVGIDTNSLAVSEAKEKGLTVYEESIEKHALNNALKYDIICGFQVLEHIPDVKLFVDACLVCLKPEGMLIIAVPNNLSFISEFDHLLSMPPHHTGLWDENSLHSISKIFNMKVDAVYKEPLQEYQKGFLKYTVYSKVFGKLYKNKFSSKILTIFLTRPFIDKHIDYFSKYFSGHTIIAVYRKIEAPVKN